MSTRTNRQRLNKATCSKDYKLILLKFEYPPYWDEGVYYRKGQFNHKYREHKTWKYNRKTQYKPLKQVIMSKYQKALVVDSSFIARSIIPVERAFVISYKGNAEVIAEHPETFGLVNPKLEIFKPSIIRVFSYVKQNIHKVPLNRENVYKRDNYECVYCGSSNQRTLTLDHVIPQSKGGKDSWDNLVTACRTCNHEKADLTLEEYGKDIPEPKRPHYLMLLRQVQDIPKEWETFLFF